MAAPTLVSLGGGQWAVDTLGSAPNDGAFVRVGNTVVIDDSITSGLTIVVSGANISVSDAAAPAPDPVVSSSKSHGRRRRRLFATPVLDAHGRVIGYVSNSPVF